jgi:hypothetical protein
MFCPRIKIYGLIFIFLDKDKDELGFRNMRIINQDHVLKLVRRLISTSLEKL